VAFNISGIAKFLQKLLHIFQMVDFASVQRNSLAITVANNNCPVLCMCKEDYMLTGRQEHFEVVGTSGIKSSHKQILLLLFFMVFYVFIYYFVYFFTYFCFGSLLDAIVLVSN